MCVSKVTRAVIVASLVAGAVSFVCLILYFLALTDIWHESGSPDFWRGEGLCSFEWRFLSACYLPMFLFHLVFFVAAALVIRNREDSPLSSKN